jgi:hypothetical protein
VPDLVVLFLHLLTTVVRLAGPGGARSIVAESLLIKHQLLILNRSRKRSPSLRLSDRVHPLGSCRDGPMHASHRGLRCASRRRGGCGAVPDVSIERRAATLPPHTLVRTMIPCIGSTNGNGIFGFST